MKPICVLFFCLAMFGLPAVSAPKPLHAFRFNLCADRIEGLRLLDGTGKLLLQWTQDFAT